MLGYLTARRWVCLLLPAFLAILIHLPALSAELYWDDRSLILEHDRIGEVGFIKEVFSRDYGQELSEHTKIGYYRPLLLALNYGLFHLIGPSPLAYHAVILLAFCFSCVLLTALSMQALGEDRRWLALTIGCLAAVHPVRTEFAMFFMTMPDLMLEIFNLTIIGICLGFFGKWRNSVQMLLLAGLATAAGLTKETGYFVVGAVGATLILSGVLARTNRDRIGQGVSLFAGLGAALGLRSWEGIGTPAGGVWPFDFLTSGADLALAGLIRSIGNVAIPSSTVFMSPTEPWLTSGSALAVAAALVVAAYAIFGLVRRGEIFAALMAAWLSGGLVSLMLLSARQIPYSDRYIPSGAAIVILCLLADGAWKSVRGRFTRTRAVPALLVTGYVGITAVFGWLSAMQCESALTFFVAMAEENPKYFYPRLVIANILFSHYQNLDLAEDYVHQAVMLAPDQPKVRTVGMAVARRFIELREYQRGLAALEWSTKDLPASAEFWGLRAKAQAGLRDLIGATISLQRAVDLAPQDPEYRRRLAEISAAADEATP